jgi:hypothetical protein
MPPPVVSEDVAQPSADDLELSAGSEDEPGPRMPVYSGTKFIQTKYPHYSFRPGRFVRVVLDREIILEKGSVLMFSLDEENVVLDMTEAEAKAFFEVTDRGAARGARREPSADPLSEPASSSQPEPEPPEDVVTMTPDEPDNRLSDDETDQPPLENVTPVPDWAADDDLEDGDVASVVQPISPKPQVSPQVGRIILAMYYLYGNEQRQVPTSTIAPLLDRNDVKQVSGLLAQASRWGYADRLPQQEGERIHWQLTPSGVDLARGLGTWPYTHRNLPVPEWLRMLARHSARG